MTFSIGFRAPSVDEVVTSFADYIGEQLGDSQRYGDADLQPPLDVGELDDQAIARVRDLLLNAIDRPEQMAQWFGRAMTQPKYLDQVVPAESATTPAALRASLERGDQLMRSPGSRFAWRRQDDTRATLFVDGDAVSCDPELARYLAAKTRIDADVLEYLDSERVLAALLDSGSLSGVDDEDEESSER
jgi:50S ribosomal protein L16 3-hydroxylase